MSATQKDNSPVTGQVAGEYTNNGSSTISSNNIVPESDNVKFTVATSSTRLTKEMSLENGALVKDGGTQMYEGELNVIEIPFAEVEKLLCGLKANQAIITGTFDTKRHGNPVRCVTKTAKSEDYPDDDNVICRSQEYLFFHPDPGVMVLDRDGGMGFNEFRTGLIAVMPELADVPMLQRASSSSCIYDDDGNELRGMSGQHVYIPVLDTTLIPKFKDIIEHRLWLAGLGHIMVSTTGALLPRCLVDLAVFSPERLVYEAAPILADGLTQNKPDAVYVKGGNDA